MWGHPRTGKGRRKVEDLCAPLLMANNEVGDKRAENRRSGKARNLRPGLTASQMQSRLSVPAPSECLHGRLPCCLISVRGSSVLVVPFKCFRITICPEGQSFFV